MRYAGHSAYVLGFHGCDREVGEAVLSGRSELAESTNNYDWLGHGIYFWENNNERATKWAVERSKRPESSIKEPFVVGAIIDLKRCFSLMQDDHIEMLRDAHAALEKAIGESGDQMPENTGGTDRFLRKLDCAVMQMLHVRRELLGLRSFHSVRGLFREGEEVYSNAAVHTGNHIQICVRNRDSIKGYFRPII